METAHPRLVVSLSTVPWRVNNLLPLLENLHRQERRPDKVYIHVPQYLKRRQMAYPPLPVALLQYAANELPFPVHFNWCEDQGPITKLYPVLEHELHGDTIIVLMDDDTLFPSHKLAYVEHILREAPERIAIAGGGWIVDNPLGPRGFAYVGKAETLTEVSVLQGNDGMAFHRSAFTHAQDLLDYSSLPSTTLRHYAYMNDDVWISRWFETRGVHKYVHPGCERLFQSDGGDGLSRDQIVFRYRLVALLCALRQQGFFPQRNTQPALQTINTYVYATIGGVLLSVLVLYHLVRHLRNK